MTDEQAAAGDLYCVIDTESSGLFNFKLPADHPSQPRLCEVAMIRLKPDLTVDGYYHAYIKPDGWAIEPGAAAVNGLTVEFLEEHGKPVAEVLAVYADIIEQGYIIVAHNAQHDLKMMRGEMRRAGVPDLFDKTRNVCTMRSGTGHVMKSDGKIGGWPKLSDCCAHFGIEVEAKLHGAQGDAERCYQTFLKLNEMGVMQAPEVHTSKNKEAIEAAGRGETVPTKPKAKRAAKAKPAAVSADDEIPL